MDLTTRSARNLLCTFVEFHQSLVLGTHDVPQNSWPCLRLNLMFCYINLVIWQLQGVKHHDSYHSLTEKHLDNLVQSRHIANPLASRPAIAQNCDKLSGWLSNLTTKKCTGGGVDEKECLKNCHRAGGLIGYCCWRKANQPNKRMQQFWQPAQPVKWIPASKWKPCVPAMNAASSLTRIHDMHLGLASCQTSSRFNLHGSVKAVASWPLTCY